MKKTTATVFVFIVCLMFSACGANEPSAETKQQVAAPEDVSGNVTETDTEASDTTEIHVPSKEDVLAMRATVLEGMSEEEIGRLTENIKVANLQMEEAYLEEDIFDKLSDKESLYWNYFEQAGEIQTGWSYEGSAVERKAIMADEGLSEREFYEKYGEPVMNYNKLDAANFIDLIADMQKSVQNELLLADLQQLIDLTILAEETHEMDYANGIYKILHDMDYYLLRYGIEDVGKYTTDDGVVSEYYGVLAVYGATPFQTDAENRYHVLFSQTVENDASKYGEIRQEHETFENQDGSAYYYYDMECFYFDDNFPDTLNETLQTYYDAQREAYCQDSESYADVVSEEMYIPYGRLIFQYFTYVGDDYISLVYNDVAYMGGAHPYSALEGVTIDCHTGEMLSVSHFLDDSEKEIAEGIKRALGIDGYRSQEWDYYITENSVVFFHYDPHLLQLAATKRAR